MPWIDVLASDDVAPGAKEAIELPGADLVVWRTATGVLAACDSRCPHQWSHLAGEGVVDGEELVCVSHFWRFDTEGHGSKLSMAGRRDPKGDVRYGRAHRQLRRQWESRVARGNEFCIRGGEVIDPSDRGDLDHRDGGGPMDYAGVSHSRCNRATNRRRDEVPLDIPTRIW